MNRAFGRVLGVAFVLVVMGQAAVGQVYSWNVASGSWGNASNWIPEGRLPPYSDDIMYIQYGSGSGATCTIDFGAEPESVSAVHVQSVGWVAAGNPPSS